ncbi:hypothetical protein GUITHDRAFT_121933 [Guillardia theta CCMP2712]|uniref:Tyrosine-protein kinase ephrin type A/B receptor-like domain-containing protein n=1 Tax=Guillardia theta (strain CCMP2712) TaxID=905079 RepID=L1I7Q6_GUITC|nr:hypothetical protein GUITHDRAFT_121933 [Guillardia theta CCMP2712]EKX31885.1 hypothetical protein GUITHDRAFT_121933 [Guillardia theta CCMP2712]|eukprot:XP_005818865.1 hypothetical protein GUITHDRAFT_121933 [Guillardia theta CCMP2712]
MSVTIELYPELLGLATPSSWVSASGCIDHSECKQNEFCKITWCNSWEGWFYKCGNCVPCSQCLCNEDSITQACPSDRCPAQPAESVRYLQGRFSSTHPIPGTNYSCVFAIKFEGLLFEHVQVAVENRSNVVTPTTIPVATCARFQGKGIFNLSQTSLSFFYTEGDYKPFQWHKGSFWNNCSAGFRIFLTSPTGLPLNYSLTPAPGTRAAWHDASVQPVLGSAGAIVGTWKSRALFEGTYCELVTEILPLQGSNFHQHNFHLLNCSSTKRGFTLTKVGRDPPAGKSTARKLLSEGGSTNGDAGAAGGMESKSRKGVEGGRDPDASRSSVQLRATTTMPVEVIEAAAEAGGGNVTSGAIQVSTPTSSSPVYRTWLIKPTSSPRLIALQISMTGSLLASDYINISAALPAALNADLSWSTTLLPGVQCGTPCTSQATSAYPTFCRVQTCRKVAYSRGLSKAFLTSSNFKNGQIVNVTYRATNLEEADIGLLIQSLVSSPSASFTFTFTAYSKNAVCQIGQYTEPSKLGLRWTIPPYLTKSLAEAWVVDYVNQTSATFWSDCSDCAQGNTTLYFADNGGEQACGTICPAGMYSATGLNPCLDCPVGTYQPVRAGTKCMPCPSSYSTADKNAISRDQCFYAIVLLERVWRSGQILKFVVYWQFTTNIAFPPNKVSIYKDGRQLAWFSTVLYPDPAPSGYSGSNTLESESAGLGNYTLLLYSSMDNFSNPAINVAGGAIVASYTFLIQNEILTDSCLGSDPLTCIPADVGKSINSSGVLCSSGYLARILNLRFCPPCSPGNAGVLFCAPCPVGFYADTAGLSSCTPCPVINGIPYATAFEGAGASCSGQACCQPCPTLIQLGFNPIQCRQNTAQATTAAPTTAAPTTRPVTTTTRAAVIETTEIATTPAPTTTAVLATPAPVAFCGDGVRQERETGCWSAAYGGMRLCEDPAIMLGNDLRWHLREECDDGNRIDGDGCSANCTVELGFGCFGSSPDVCRYPTRSDQFLTMAALLGSLSGISSAETVLANTTDVGRLNLHLFEMLGLQATFRAIYQTSLQDRLTNEAANVALNPFGCPCQQGYQEIMEQSGRVGVPAGVFVNSGRCQWRVAPVNASTVTLYLQHHMRKNEWLEIMDSGIYPQDQQVPSSNCYPCKFVGKSNVSAVTVHVGSFFTATFYYSEMKEVEQRYSWEDVFNLTFFANGTSSFPDTLPYLLEAVREAADVNMTNTSGQPPPPATTPPDSLVMKVGEAVDSWTYPCQFGSTNGTQPLGVTEFLFRRHEDSWEDFTGEWEGQTYADGNRDGLFDNVGRVRCGEVGFIRQQDQVYQPDHCMTLCVQDAACSFASYNDKFFTCILLRSCQLEPSFNAQDPIIYKKKEGVHNLLCMLKVSVVGLRISVHVHGCDGKEDGVRRSAHEGWATGYIFPLPDGATPCNQGRDPIPCRFIDPISKFQYWGYVPFSIVFSSSSSILAVGDVYNAILTRSLNDVIDVFQLSVSREWQLQIYMPLSLVNSQNYPQVNNVLFPFVQQPSNATLWNLKPTSAAELRFQVQEIDQKGFLQQLNVYRTCNDSLSTLRQFASRTPDCLLIFSSIFRADGTIGPSRVDSATMDKICQSSCYQDFKATLEASALKCSAAWKSTDSSFFSFLPGLSIPVVNEQSIMTRRILGKLLDLTDALFNISTICFGNEKGQRCVQPLLESRSELGSCPVSSLLSSPSSSSLFSSVPSLAEEIQNPPFNFAGSPTCPSTCSSSLNAFFILDGCCSSTVNEATRSWWDLVGHDLSPSFILQDPSRRGNLFFQKPQACGGSYVSMDCAAGQCGNKNLPAVCCNVTCAGGGVKSYLSACSCSCPEKLTGKLCNESNTHVLAEFNIIGISVSDFSLEGNQALFMAILAEVAGVDPSKVEIDSFVPFPRRRKLSHLGQLSPSSSLPPSQLLQTEQQGVTIRFRVIMPSEREAVRVAQIVVEGDKSQSLVDKLKALGDVTLSLAFLPKAFAANGGQLCDDILYKCNVTGGATANGTSSSSSSSSSSFNVLHVVYPLVGVLGGALVLCMAYPFLVKGCGWLRPRADAMWKKLDVEGRVEAYREDMRISTQEKEKKKKKKQQKTFVEDRWSLNNVFSSGATSSAKQHQHEAPKAYIMVSGKAMWPSASIWSPEDHGGGGGETIGFIESSAKPQHITFDLGQVEEGEKGRR